MTNQARGEIISGFSFVKISFSLVFFSKNRRKSVLIPTKANCGEKKTDVCVDDVKITFNAKYEVMVIYSVHLTPSRRELHCWPSLMQPLFFVSFSPFVVVRCCRRRLKSVLIVVALPFVVAIVVVLS